MATTQSVKIIVMATKVEKIYQMAHAEIKAKTLLCFGAKSRNKIGNLAAKFLLL